MPTYSDLCSRISDDIDRIDLNQQIKNEIALAIMLHQSERFWFNETRDYTDNTVSMQSDYAITPNSTIKDFIKIDSIMVTISPGQIVELSREDPKDIDWRISNLPSNGQPYSYAYYGNKFRFYPVPDQVYSFRVSGHFTAVDLSDDGDANIWTNEGFELIRSAAKFNLFANVMKDPDQASNADGVRQIILARMRTETSMRLEGGKICGTYF